MMFLIFVVCLYINYKAYSKENFTTLTTGEIGGISAGSILLFVIILYGVYLGLIHYTGKMLQSRRL